MLFNAHAAVDKLASLNVRGGVAIKREDSFHEVKVTDPSIGELIQRSEFGAAVQFILTGLWIHPIFIGLDCKMHMLGPQSRVARNAVVVSSPQGGGLLIAVGEDSETVLVLYKPVGDEENLRRELPDLANPIIPIIRD